MLNPPVDTDLTDHRPILTIHEYEHHEAQLEALRQRRDCDFRRILRQARTFVANDAAEETLHLDNDLRVLDARIAHLEALLRDAKVVSEDDHAPDVVAVGRTVTVRYSRTGKIATYYVGGSSGYSAARTVSPRSPMGRALLGRSVGDRVRVELPIGRTEELLIRGVGPSARRAA
jgi:transcription elongation factor GreA